MKSSVLVIGAGQLGSRHLQGLARCRRPLEIFVCDSSGASLARAKARWAEVAAGAERHTVAFSDQLGAAPRRLDLVIVATGASGRAALLQQIAQHGEVGAWVLEKVLAQSGEELDAMLSLLGRHERVWVNTPRRIMAWHGELRRATSLRSPTFATVTGGDWGLACNAVHFLDLLAWWSGESLIGVNADDLAPGWHESKRPGYWEVHGTLRARYSGGSECVLTCGGSPAAVSLMLRAPQREWTIRESDGVALAADGAALPGRIEYQSELSGAVADGILEHGTCGLPTLQESVALHRPFLGSLLHHWNQHMPTRLAPLPIT
jgi:predicted dehydrogenase